MSSSSETEIQTAVEPPVEQVKADVYQSTAKPKAPLTAEEWANMDKPKVLIVGAGIGGLFLGNLLHKAKIPFLIFERAKEVKNLGKRIRSHESITLFACKITLTFDRLTHRLSYVVGRLGVSVVSAARHP